MKPAFSLVPLVCFLFVMLAVSTRVAAQEPSAPQTVDTVRLQAAIDTLGALDYTKRTDAARLVRRTTPSQAVPALLAAVSQHADRKSVV